MDITRFSFSGRKSRSVNILFSSRIWDLNGVPPPGSTVQTRRIHPPGQTSQFYPPGIIMTSRVCNSGICNLNTMPKSHVWWNTHNESTDVRSSPISWFDQRSHMRSDYSETHYMSFLQQQYYNPAGSVFMPGFSFRPRSTCPYRAFCLNSHFDVCQTMPYTFFARVDFLA